MAAERTRIYDIKILSTVYYEALYIYQFINKNKLFEPISNLFQSRVFFLE